MRDRSWLGVIGGGRHISAPASPVSVEELATRLVNAFVGVRAEIIPLRLEQIGGYLLGAVAVEKRQRRAKSGHGDAAFSSHGDDIAPALLAVANSAFEEGVEQQILKAWVVCRRRP